MPLMDNLHNTKESAVHPGSARGLDIGPGGAGLVSYWTHKIEFDVIGHGTLRCPV